MFYVTHIEMYCWTFCTFIVFLALCIQRIVCMCVCVFILSSTSFLQDFGARTQLCSKFNTLHVYDVVISNIALDRFCRHGWYMYVVYAINNSLFFWCVIGFVFSCHWNHLVRLQLPIMMNHIIDKNTNITLRAHSLYNKYNHPVYAQKN